MAHNYHIIVFGGNGDLAMRKLYPALLHLTRESVLSSQSRIISSSLSQIPNQQFRDKVKQQLVKHIEKNQLDEESIDQFIKRIDYIAADAKNQSDFTSIKATLEKSPSDGLICYLATPAELYASICENLKSLGLITANTRVVLEKPIGSDLGSCAHIHNQIAEIIGEQNIFRIDHYLGKETVQNLMALRFGNVLFEPLWNHSCIDHVQITVAEEVDVGSRAGYYDGSGVLRDMFQNHQCQAS